MIGTVKGDIHDIGKNLVAMMLEGAGFEVIDLGINTPVEKYLAALEEHKPDILGMSALLTTTMPYMKVVIDTLKEKGLRDDYIVLVGGAPLNEEFGKAIGADAYCRDAAVAAETAQALVLARRAAARASCARRRPSCSRPRSRSSAPSGPRCSILACGAIAREVLAVIRLNGWTHVDVRCLPAKLHSTPRADRRRPSTRSSTELARALRARLRRLRRLRHRPARSTSCSTDTASSGCRAPTATASSPGNDAWDAMQEEEPAPST